MKVSSWRQIPCLPWKVTTFVLVVVGLFVYLYYQIGCVVSGHIQLTDSIAVNDREHTDRPGGNIISRSFDISAGRVNLGRFWCGLTPQEFGSLSAFHIAHCVGENSEYIVINDLDSFWIIDLKELARL